MSGATAPAGLLEGVLASINLGAVVLDGAHRVALWNDWMGRHAGAPATGVHVARTGVTTTLLKPAGKVSTRVMAARVGPPTPASCACWRSCGCRLTASPAPAWGPWWAAPTPPA